MALHYRKSALEKNASPEQLDKALTVTSPMSWIALAAVTLVIVVTVIWSIVGTLPVTVTSTGIIVSPTSTNAIYAPESGTITEVDVNPGDQLVEGRTIVARYRTGNGLPQTIYADQNGTVTNLIVKKDDVVKRGDQIVRLSPDTVYDSSNQIIVCYVKNQDAKKIKPGMRVTITLANAESQTYGHMVAFVINIDSYVSSSSAMAYVLGENNNLASRFQTDGSAVVAVTCELLPDPETVSGFYWSNDRGAGLTVTDGSEVTAKFVVEEVRPITKLFSKLKEIWGD